MVGRIKGVRGIKNSLKTVETGINTFTSDISDFLLGTNWFTLYYGMFINNAVEDNILWKDTFTSANADTPSAAMTSETIAKMLDIDFDASVQAERLIGGKARIESKFKLTTNDSNVEGFLVFKLVRVSNGNETIIGTTQTTTGQLNSVGTATATETLLMDVARTSFTSEDILRLTIEAWARKTEDQDASGSNITIVHDGTELIEVPFSRLDEY